MRKYWLVNANNNYIEKCVFDNEQIEEGFKNGFNLLVMDNKNKKCELFKSGDAPVK